MNITKETVGFSIIRNGESSKTDEKTVEVYFKVLSQERCLNLVGDDVEIFGSVGSEFQFRDLQKGSLPLLSPELNS
jgi:hypothetical protein